MGNFWSKMTGEWSSRVRNSSSSSVNSSSGSQARSRPIIQPVKNLRPKIPGTITKTGRNSSFSFNSNNNFSRSQPIQEDPSIASAGPAQPRNRSFFNKLRGREINTNKRQLNNNDKNEIFSQLTKNTTFVLQRHATSCANIINKGFETGSTSYLTFGKTQLVAEIAPDSMLSSIGIDECNQVHDYLTNKGTELTKLDGFDYLFCCSELIRTQQTMFLSYFELIHSKGIQIMVLPWLNEEHAIGGVNKDNLTITLAETKRRWKQFIESLIEFPVLRKLLDYLTSETSVKNKTVFIPAEKLLLKDLEEKIH